MTLDNGATSEAGDASSAEPAATPDYSTELMSIASAEDMNGVVDWAKNINSRIGRSLTIPGEDAGEEARQQFQQRVLEKVPGLIMRPNEDNLSEFYQAMGRPETADKYTAPVVEGMEFDEGSLSAFAEFALENNLTDKQYQGMAIEMQKRQALQTKQWQAEHTEGLQGLKGEWGMGYDQRVSAAQQYVDKLLPSIGDVNLLPASSIKELYNASQSIGAEGTALTHESGETVGMTPEEALQTIAEIRANPEHPWHNPRSQGNPAAVQKMLDLQDYVAGRDPALRKRV